VVVLMLVVLGVSAAAAVGQIWTRQRTIDCGYRISRANREHVRLVEINRRLEIELALLKSPQRITRIATRRLGMRPPAPEQVRRIHPPAVSRLETTRRSARRSR
jgi:cell division protein FtsL